MYPRGGVGPDPECLVGCKGNIEWGVGGLDSRGVQAVTRLGGIQPVSQFSRK